MESIYNLLPTEPIVTPKSKRYQSIHRYMAKKEMVEHKIGKFKTMGPVAVKKPNPSLFLRSHTSLNLHRNADPNDQENICPGKKPPLPNFRQKPEDFGKVPAYIERRRTEKLKNADLYACYNEEVALHQQLPRLSPEERENLLKSLKERHSQIYSEFLRLSVIIDTLHKRQRKERLEKTLSELEKDIRTIEEHELIYVKE
ncbi:Enkurin [Taenia crassiceps]|uniref:Enkurin n=1 Tax=Taenia crassiceps TaxID=6207 RepID=A0ABR4Q6E3_9CEST